MAPPPSSFSLLLLRFGRRRLPSRMGLGAFCCNHPSPSVAFRRRWRGQLHPTNFSSSSEPEIIAASTFQEELAGHAAVVDGKTIASASSVPEEVRDDVARVQLLLAPPCGGGPPSDPSKPDPDGPIHHATAAVPTTSRHEPPGRPGDPRPAPGGPIHHIIAAVFTRRREPAGRPPVEPRRPPGGGTHHHAVPPTTTMGQPPGKPRDPREGGGGKHN